MKKLAVLVVIIGSVSASFADLNGLGALADAWLLQTGESGFNPSLDYVQDGIINFCDYAFYVRPEAYNANKLYFISASNGLDTNPGTIDRPLKTITKAASLAVAGNTCFVRAGTYREKVDPLNSGTQTNPIRFVGYLSEYPIVSGADIVTGTWSVYQGSIYSSSQNALTTEQLFVDGRMYNKARWPNTNIDQLVDMNRATTDSGTNVTTLVDNALPAGNWVGATVHIVPGAEWISSTKTVATYTPGVSLTFNNSTWGDNTTPYTPRAGNHYWLYGVLSALDTPGEWVKSGTRLYIWCEGNNTPANHLIEAKKRTQAFDLSSSSYVEVKGFKIFAAAVLMDNSIGCLIDNCHIKYVDHFSVTDGYNTSYSYTKHANRMSGSNNTWKNCSIAYSAGNGILDNGTNNKVINCIIRDVDYMATYAGAINVFTNSIGGSYVFNTLHRSGRFGLWSTGKQFECKYNDMYDVGFLTEDLGITYTWGTDGGGAVFAYNYVHDNHATIFSKGIYIDNGCSNYLVHHNLIWNIPDSAIIIGDPPANEYFYNNTILSTCAHGFSGGGNQSTCKVINNLYKGTLGYFGTPPPELHHNGDYPIDANGWPLVLSSPDEVGTQEQTAVADKAKFDFPADAADSGVIVGWGRPVLTGDLSMRFTSVSANSYHCLGLKADGSVAAWGRNVEGQCSVPLPNADFNSVAAGWQHSLGLKADGSIAAWGHNTEGQCNIPSPNTGFIAISAGWYHSLGLKADGSVFVWGANGNGQCDIPAPNADFTAISAGTAHSVGLKADGSVFVWGENGNGQCDVPMPNEGFIAIAAGDSHNLGIKNDSSIVAWGSNYYGECDVPEPNNGFISISAGNGYSLGLKTDGSVVAWGSNSNGQCNVPAPNTNFTAIAAGGGYSLGIRNIASTPIFTLDSGTYYLGDNVVVTITCPTPDALIRYTTDGSEPDETNGTEIVSGTEIILTESCILTAKAWADGVGPSMIKSAQYDILTTAATPVFTPDSGLYLSGTQVKITCATPNAVIHYTTNGVDPNESDPVIASGDTLTIDKQFTLKAKAWRIGLTPSGIKTANYEIDTGAIDKGYIIPGITDGFVGSAPDIGCYEVGTEGWTAGADWQEFAW